MNTIIRMALALGMFSCAVLPLKAQGHAGHAHGAPPQKFQFEEKDAQAKEPPKDGLFHFDLTGYTEDVRKKIVEEAQNTPCECGCGMTVAYCLFADPTCQTSPEMANKIIAKHSGRPYPRVILNREIGVLIVGVDTAKMDAKQADALARRLEKTKCSCGCGMSALDCLRDDPTCMASPLLLAKAYKEITGKDLPEAEVLELPVTEKPHYDTLPRVDTSKLSPAQFAKLLKACNIHYCDCGCGMTLAQCLNDDPTCTISPGLVNTMIFDLLTGND